MPLPKGTIIGQAVIAYLQAHGGTATAKDVKINVAKALKLSDADVTSRRSVGTHNRTEPNWGLRLRQVRFELVRTGKLTPSTQRGIWTLIV